MYMHMFYFIIWLYYKIYCDRIQPRRIMLSALLSFLCCSTRGGRRVSSGPMMKPGWKGDGRDRPNRMNPSSKSRLLPRPDLCTGLSDLPNLMKLSLDLPNRMKFSLPLPNRMKLSLARPNLMKLALADKDRGFLARFSLLSPSSPCNKPYIYNFLY